MIGQNPTPCALVPMCDSQRSVRAATSGPSSSILTFLCPIFPYRRDREANIGQQLPLQNRGSPRKRRTICSCHPPRPLDTRYIIKTQEKSTSAPTSGRPRRDFHPLRCDSSFSIYRSDDASNQQRMNTLHPKYIHFQDFSHLRTWRSGLMSYLLNTLRKGTGEGPPQPEKVSTIRNSMNNRRVNVT
jgi:hypothetical protein